MFGCEHRCDWTVNSSEVILMGSKVIFASHVGQKSSASAKSREQEHLEMIQRYKAEKELRKLNEQRKPIFKCGKFKPEAPAFLLEPSNRPVLNKPKEFGRRRRVWI